MHFKIICRIKFVLNKEENIFAPCEKYENNMNKF